MDNLTRLVRSLAAMPNETEWLEFKMSNYDPGMIGADISALANGATLSNRPFAYMVWGVDDKTHEVVGTKFDPQSLKVGNQEFELWARMLLSDNAEFECVRGEADGRPVVVLKISSASSRPVAFKKVEYVRVGSYTKRLADVPSVQARLWDRLRGRRFESGEALSGLSVGEAVALLDVQRCFDGLGRPQPSSPESAMDYMSREGLVARTDDGLWSVTNLGAVLFAKRLTDFPGLGRKALRVVRYFGADRLASNKEEEVGAGYASGFPEMLRLVSAMVPSSEVVGEALREERGGYPAIALREAVANALVHQDLSVSGAGPMVEIFDQRLEVTNPGAPLVDPMRIIDAPPRSRNESMAALMRRMRMCEEKGSGWDKIAGSCELAELPSPRIRTYEEGTRVTLYTHRDFQAISPEDREWACYVHACLRFVGGQEYMTNATLRRRFGLGEGSKSVVSKLIKRAVDDGLVKPLDPHASPRYMRYVPAWA